MNRYLPKIIAHRGASAHAPENTLMAIRLAKDMGAEAVEIDVCLTKDRQPAVTHNHDLQKIFGIEGYVFDITFAQLKKYNTSFKFDNKLQKTSVPHLREVLSLCQDLSLMLNIELKPINGDEQELAQAVDDVLKQFPNFWDLIWITSFSNKALHCMHSINTKIPLGFIIDNIMDDLADKFTNTFFQALVVDHNLITQTNYIELKGIANKIYAYTVNETSRAAKLFNFGIDGIFTDYPDKFYDA